MRLARDGTNSGSRTAEPGQVTLSARKAHGAFSSAGPSSIRCEVTMRRPGLFLPLLAALACGSTARHSALETLPPPSADDPIVACMDAVLANSPLIERVTTSRRSDHPRTRYLVLRNPPGPRSSVLGFAVEPSRGTPRELVVEYAWPGPGQEANGMQPPPDPRASDIEGQP